MHGTITLESHGGDTLRYRLSMRATVRIARPTRGVTGSQSPFCWSLPLWRSTRTGRVMPSNRASPISRARRQRSHRCRGQAPGYRVEDRVVPRDGADLATAARRRQLRVPPLNGTARSNRAAEELGLEG